MQQPAGALHFGFTFIHFIASKQHLSISYCKRFQCIMPPSDDLPPTSDTCGKSSSLFRQLFYFNLRRASRFCCHGCHKHQYKAVSHIVKGKQQTGNRRRYPSFSQPHARQHIPLQKKQILCAPVCFRQIILCV